MIEHCYNNTKSALGAENTYIATCDEEIKDYMQSIGANVVMTSNSHTGATTRTAEALGIIENKSKDSFEIIVMVQGDEPMINEIMIDQALKPMLKDNNIYVTNLLGKIKSKEELNNKNKIKVVCDQYSYALYFSRSPIPDKITNYPFYGKQVCVIPFEKNFLFEYSSMKETQLEISESIDMLRILENGKKVYMAKTEYNNQSVDTLEELDIVNSLLNKND